MQTTISKHLTSLNLQLTKKNKHKNRLRVNVPIVNLFNGAKVYRDRTKTTHSHWIWPSVLFSFCGTVQWRHDLEHCGSHCTFPSFSLIRIFWLCTYQTGSWNVNWYYPCVAVFRWRSHPKELHKTVLHKHAHCPSRLYNGMTLWHVVIIMDAIQPIN